MKDPRPMFGARTRGTGDKPGAGGWAVALSLGVLCITLCEYSQLVFVSPSSASSMGFGETDLLARATSFPAVRAENGRGTVAEPVGLSKPNLRLKSGLPERLASV
jgi:hypothetical protein